MFTIMNNDKAYILGFLATDGYNSNRYISWEQQQKDYEILKNIANIFIINGYNPKLKFLSKTINNFNYSSLKVHNIKLCSQLTEIGIMKKKSSIIQMPEIEEIYIPDFLRGVIDGDGSITIRRNNIEIEIYSKSQIFLQQILNYLYSKLDIKIKKISPHAGCYRISFYAKESEKICNLIYSTSSTLFINRKKEKFINFNKEISKRWWTKEQLQYLKDNYNKIPILQIAEKLNRTYKSVSKKIWELNLNNRE